MDAAVQLLEERGGLSARAEVLNLEEVIARAGVSRSAVFRVWRAAPTHSGRSGPRELFLEELLAHLAGPDFTEASSFDVQTLVVAQQVLDQVRADAPIEARRAALLESVRLGALQNYCALISRQSWKNFVILSLTARSMPEGPQRERVLELLRVSDDTATNAMANFYRGAFDALGLRPKPPFTVEDACALLARLGGAIVEGLAVHHFSQSSVTAERIDLNGSPWSLASLGFLAVTDALVEVVEPE